MIGHAGKACDNLCPVLELKTKKIYIYSNVHLYYHILYANMFAKETKHQTHIFFSQASGWTLAQLAVAHLMHHPQGLCPNFFGRLR